MILHYNDLLFVSGGVGSGKSTFLMSILKEANVIHGEVIVKGKVGYVSQYPVIFNGTVMENIVFGQEYDDNRLHRVIEMC